MKDRHASSQATAAMVFPFVECFQRVRYMSINRRLRRISSQAK